MELGMVGLGRMGGNMVRRLMRGGHVVVVHATDAEAVRHSPTRARSARCRSTSSSSGSRRRAPSG